MVETSWEFPPVERLLARGRRRDTSIFGVAATLLLCAMLLALVLVPRPAVTAETGQDGKRRIDGPLFP